MTFGHQMTLGDFQFLSRSDKNSWCFLLLSGPAQIVDFLRRIQDYINHSIQVQLPLDNIKCVTPNWINDAEERGRSGAVCWINGRSSCSSFLLSEALLMSSKWNDDRITVTPSHNMLCRFFVDFFMLFSHARLLFFLSISPPFWFRMKQKTVAF